MIDHNWYLEKKGSILACAPTNIAANVLLSYLIVDRGLVSVRIGAQTEQKSALMKYSNQWLDFFVRGGKNDLVGKRKLRHENEASSGVVSISTMILHFYNEGL